MFVFLTIVLASVVSRGQINTPIWNELNCDEIHCSVAKPVTGEFDQFYISKKNGVSAECSEEVLTRKKKVIAEAILALIDDEIRINSVLINRKADLTKKQSLGLDNMNNNDFVVRTEKQNKILKRMKDKIMPRSYQRWKDLLAQINYHRSSNKSVLRDVKTLKNIAEEDMALNTDTVEAKLLENVEKKRRTNTDLKTFVQGSQKNTSAVNLNVLELPSTSIAEEFNNRELFDFDAFLGPSSHVAPSPFRGIFQSPFNTGFAEFGNHFSGTTDAPYDLSPNPVHFLTCSSSNTFTSRSSCDNKVCSVKCEDGNKVYLNCDSNSVVVHARSVEGKLSYEVTCGTRDSNEI